MNLQWKFLMAVVSMVFVLGLSTARAEILPGNVTGFSVLGCVMNNFTGTSQIVDQVQYRWACNHGPRDPYHLYFQSFSCLGNCQVAAHSTYWHNNGPFTYNCMLIHADCQGFSHPEPTPRPTP